MGEDGLVFGGVDGVVDVLVVGFARGEDVGRDGSEADVVEEGRGREGGVVGVGADVPAFIGGAIEEFEGEGCWLGGAVEEADADAGFGAAHFEEGGGRRRGLIGERRRDDEAFNLAFGVFADAFEAGGHDAGGVEDEEVVWGEEGGEVADVEVIDAVGVGARDDHEAGGVSRGDGGRGDEVGGEVVVESGGGEHDGG